MRIQLNRHADSLSRVVYGAGFVAVFAAVYAMFLIAAVNPALAYADDPAAAAATISNQAFGMLNGLNAESGGGNANPLLGPIASFAGDADTLSHVLKGGDKAAAAQALGALKLDRAAVDAAIAAHPKAMSTGAWASLTHQLDALAKQVPHTADAAASPAMATVSATAPSTATSDAAAAAVASAPASAMAGPAPSSDGAAPKVVIDSRVERDDIVTIKGYFKGTALKSAGIYEDGQALKSFKVDNVPGEQQVNFTLGLEHPRSDMVLRVADVHGRSAEASVLDPAIAAAANSGTPDASAPPPETLADVAPPPSSEPPVKVLRDSPSSGGHGATAVIPSHGPIRPSPSKRHTIGGHLGSVQINIIGTAEVSTSPASYEVIGQISGHGITRAGIYVDGRLVKRIPVTEGGDFSSFDQRFVMNGGEATIRAYGVGDQYVESSIDVTGNGVATAAPPMMMPPIGMAIQITTLRPVAANLYLVGGVISGRNIASAGLYQNEMLVRTIPLHSSLLGAIIPGASQQIAFNVRFNPSLGAALIRAFDTAGAHTDQPVMVTGTSPYGYGMNPYAINPYGARGYGVNPYAPNPYGASPVNPYLPPANPYATSPYGYRGAPARPLW
ncbi:MAG: hypothetical protein ACREQN_02540 [Candidatus Binataceae bacterium]